jgi:hypothetical protein
MASQTVTGPTTLTIGLGQTSTTGQYFASKTPATWSVSVQNDGALNPGDYSVTVSSTGLVEVTLSPSATIPPSDVTLSIIVSASSGPGNGNNDSLAVSVQIDLDAVPCFVQGTLIDTETGPRPVEELVVGDRVLTRDGGSTAIRWIGSCHLGMEALIQSTNLVPVRIRQDALGPGLPSRDLFVSPQHRIFVEGWQAELLFGETAVLVHAKHLLNDRSIVRDFSLKSVTYFHFALEKHQVVFANSLPAESLFLGDMALSAVSRPDANELYALFPELEHPNIGTSTQLYTRCLRSHEGRILSAKLQ